MLCNLSKDVTNFVNGIVMSVIIFTTSLANRVSLSQMDDMFLEEPALEYVPPQSFVMSSIDIFAVSVEMTALAKCSSR